MNIALLACNKRRELMLRFCVSYYKILLEHSFFAVTNIIRFLSNSVKLNFFYELNDDFDGYQEICSKISYNEVDLLISFNSNFQSIELINNKIDVLRLCDIYNVPIATNIATAEILVHGLSRGDFEWRKVGIPVI